MLSSRNAHHSFLYICYILFCMSRKCHPHMFVKCKYMAYGIYSPANFVVQLARVILMYLETHIHTSVLLCVPGPYTHYTHICINMHSYTHRFDIIYGLRRLICAYLFRNCQPLPPDDATVCLSANQAAIFLYV